MLPDKQKQNRRQNKKWKKERKERMNMSELITLRLD